MVDLIFLRDLLLIFNMQFIQNFFLVLQNFSYPKKALKAVELDLNINLIN